MEGPTNITIVIVDLKDPSKQEKKKRRVFQICTRGYISSQVVIATHLLTRKMRRIKEPLIDINMSHVVTFEKYLNIIQ